MRTSSTPPDRSNEVDVDFVLTAASTLDAVNKVNVRLPDGNEVTAHFEIEDGLDQFQARVATVLEVSVSDTGEQITDLSKDARDQISSEIRRQNASAMRNKTGRR